MMEENMEFQNDKSMLSETKIGEFVWASKFYSRLLNQVVWIVLGHPFNLADEEAYWKVKNNLKLSRRGKKEWKIFPYPFTPEDGLSVYFMKTTYRRRSHDFSKNNSPQVYAEVSILQVLNRTSKG